MNHLIVNVDVPDLDKGLAFYERVFGLKLLQRYGGAGVAELSGLGCRFFLLQKKAGTPGWPGGTPRSYERHWTPVHLDLHVDDLEGSVARAVEAGAHIQSGIADHDWGRIAILSDPFGNGFCLLQYRDGAA